MKIIISPAKIMKEEVLGVEELSTPIFKNDASHIWQYLKSASNEELNKIWDCNENLTILNKKRLDQYDLNSNLSSALLTYDGLQYKKMTPNVFSEDMWHYINTHLFILSGLYGVLRPNDGINPYRLMMGSNISLDGFKNLYAYWGDRLYKEITKDDNLILNLASKEYSDAITPYKKDDVKIVDVVFLCLNKNKLVTKATEAKACRGLMVRFLAEHQIDDIEQVKLFNEMGYQFDETNSNDSTLVFIKK